MKIIVFSWALLMFAALLDSYASFIFKMKFNELGHFDFSSSQKLLNYIAQLVKSPILLTAVGTFCLAPFLWFVALNRIDLSVGYPALVGFHLIFIMAFGVLLLGETFTVQKMIGLILVILSFYFLYE